jgi:Niemann-Pick C1 protein
MRPDQLKQAVTLHQDFVSAVDGNGDDFTEHCFSVNIPGLPQTCRISNIFETFSYDPNNVPGTEADILALMNTLNSVSPITSSFGGVAYDTAASPPAVLSADTLILSYSLSNPGNGALLAYETMLLDTFSFDNLESDYPELKVTRLSSAGFDEEVKRLVVDDMPLFLLAILLIITFTSLTFGKLTRHTNRLLLAWITFPMVMFSLLFATGLQGYFNSKISTLNFLVGFILSGISVDDMIVIEEYHRRSKNNGSKEVLRDTMKDAGLAVFLTSITSCLAFLAGAFVDLPAVRSFCISSGLAFFWNFALNMTMFPALLHLDERRCGMPCASRADLTAQSSTASKSTESFSSNKDQDLTFAEKIFENCVSPILTIPTVQIIVVVLGIGSAVGMLLYGMDISVGLAVTEVVPDDSFVVDYFDLVTEKFDNPVKLIELSVSNVDYTSSSDVGKLKALFTDIEAEPKVDSVVGGVFGHWYDHYTSYLLANGYDAYADFGKDYTAFLASNSCSGNECITYALDVVGDINLDTGELTSVAAAKFSFMELSPNETGEMWKVYGELNELLEKHDVEGFYFLEMFLFAENDAMMFSYLFKSLGVTLSAIGCLMYIFTDSLSTIYIVLSVCCIDCHLLGFARAWDTKLNSVMFTCMIMSVGLSVDYCVHIAHAFVHARGADKSADARLKTALMGLGPAVLKGGFTTLLGVIALSQASSSVFRMFFRMLFLTVVFGLTYGIVVMPAMMTVHQKIAERIFGTKDGSYQEREEDEKSGDAEKEEDSGGLYSL